MKFMLISITLLVLAACDDDRVTICSRWAELPVPALTPAPPDETPIGRWKRASADYDRADQLRRDVYEKIRAAEPDTWQLVWPAFKARADAESALKSAKCNALCSPEHQDE